MQSYRHITLYIDVSAWDPVTDRGPLIRFNNHVQICKQFLIKKKQLTDTVVWICAQNGSDEVLVKYLSSLTELSTFAFVSTWDKHELTFKWNVQQ